MNDKSDELCSLVSDLLDRGVPIDGVGLQMQLLHDHPDPDAVGENVARFRDLGLSVEITEMDVAFPDDSVPDDHLAVQAEYCRDVVEAALGAGCETFVVWGVDDGHS